ncbi:MAG: carbohydrate ABC transporter permease [Chloroflexota bacterium]|nr:carbohydrate ABC transporter permease [Chloroflexota bacterium]
MTTTAVGAQSGAASGRAGRMLRRLPLHLVILFLMAVWLIPTIGLFVNSFRPPESLTQSGWWTAIFSPWQFTLDNYAHVLAQQNITAGFVNSLFIAIPATVIPILVAAFAAYAFAWMRFPGRDVLFVVVVGLLVIPLQSTFIPILQLFGPKGLDIAGSFLAVWLAHTAYGLPFAIFLLRNFMGELPREVFESASLDGASPVTAFLRLALPMTIPAIAALAIFQFLFTWNDLLVALIYLGAQNPDNAPLTIVVSNLVSSLGGGWQYLAAAAFVTMAVPLLVFLGLQRYFVRGIVGGSVKG